MSVKTASLTKRSDSLITIEMTEITPDFAKELLALPYDRNRRIDTFLVERYAAEMRAGNWDANGETIKIDEQERLVDGQHRLTAVVVSGVTIWSAVAWGLDTGVFRSIDRGKPRTIGDSLKFDGEINWGTTAAVLAWILRWENRKGGIPHHPVVRLTPKKARELLDDNPSVRDSVFLANSKKQAFAGMCAPSMIAFSHWLFAQKDENMAETFLHQLASGAALEEGHPALLARERMRSMRSQRTSYVDYEYLAILILAWNALRRGRRNLKGVYWRIANVAFPFPA